MESKGEIKSFSPPKVISGIGGETSVASIEVPEVLKIFFDPIYGVRYSTKFLIGKEKIVLYGNPPTMSVRSELIKANIRAMSESKEPYDLAPTNGVKYPKSLMSAWAYMSASKLWVSGLESAEEHLDVWNWLNYFGVPLDDPVLVRDWMGYLMTNIQISDLSPESQLLLNKIINKRLDYAYLLGYQDIIKETFNYLEEHKWNDRYIKIGILPRNIDGFNNAGDPEEWIYIRKSSLENKQHLIEDLRIQKFAHYQNSYTTNLDPVFTNNDSNLYIVDLIAKKLYPIGYDEIIYYDTLVVPTEKGYRYLKGVKHRDTEYYKQVGDRLEPYTGFPISIYKHAIEDAKQEGQILVKSTARWDGAILEKELARFGFIGDLPKMEYEKAYYYYNTAILTRFGKQYELDASDDQYFTLREISP